MYTIFSNSTTTEAAAPKAMRGDVVTTMEIDVIDEGAWSGSIKFLSRMEGGAYTAANYLAIRNRQTDAIIDGSTGITTAGAYSVDASGREITVEHTNSGGGVSVYGNLLRG